MARYNLIIKDSDYALLVELTQKLHLSIGKFLNIKIHEIVTTPIANNADPVCCICGAKPEVQLVAFPDVLYLCGNHSPLKKHFQGHKELVQNV